MIPTFLMLWRWVTTTSPPPLNFSFPKIQINPGYYTTVIPHEGIQHRIPDTGYPFKVYLNPCSHSIHSNAFSCALAAKPPSQPKCILLPWISWHKLVREWRMQSVPSHFSTCTNTRDLETLHKFLLTSYRQSLNGLKCANCSGDNTSIYQRDLKCSLQQNLPSLGSDKGAAAVPTEPARREGTVSTATSPLPSCTMTKTNWTGQSTSDGFRKALMLEDHSELTSRSHSRQDTGPWGDTLLWRDSSDQICFRRKLKRYYNSFPFCCLSGIRNQNILKKSKGFILLGNEHNRHIQLPLMQPIKYPT